MITSNAALTQGDPVDPIKPVLPNLEIIWKVDGHLVATKPAPSTSAPPATSTSVKKDADSTSTIEISAILKVNNVDVDIKSLVPEKIKKSKFFKIKPPISSVGAGSTPSTSPSGTSPASPLTPAGSSTVTSPGTPRAGTARSKEKRIDLRCKFYLESEVEFRTKTDKKRRETVTIKIVPEHEVIKKLAAFKGLSLFLVIEVELTPCTIQLFEPVPDVLGDPNKHFNEKTALKARVVRSKDKADFALSHPVGIPGNKINQDHGRDPSPRVWFEFVFHAPIIRPWLTETLLKMAVKDSSASYRRKYRIREWDGSHYDNGAKLTNGPFQSSDDWVANKHNLKWEKALASHNRAKTPKNQLREKKKAEKHIAKSLGVSDKGFLKFSNDIRNHYGYEYDHLKSFGVQGDLGRSDPFYDLRNISCMKFRTDPKSYDHSRGERNRNTNGRVEFSIWYNYGSAVTDTDKWDPCGKRETEILVPDILDNGEVPPGSKNWFIANSCHESVAIYISKNDPRSSVTGKSHEFNSGTALKRIMWGAYQNFYCHDYAWRMPGERTRVDLLGCGDAWVKDIKADPAKFGYDSFGWSTAKINDIVVFSNGDHDPTTHSAVVLQITSPESFMNKDTMNGVFKSYNSDNDDFKKRYGKGGLTWIRRVKCMDCKGRITGFEPYCPTCGPAKPGTWGISGWPQPTP